MYETLDVLIQLNFKTTGIEKLSKKTTTMNGDIFGYRYSVSTTFCQYYVIYKKSIKILSQGARFHHDMRPQPPKNTGKQINKQQLK